MNLRHTGNVNPKLVKVVAAVIMGLSIGTLIPPEPVIVPAIGVVPGLVAGSIGFVTGAVLYL